MSAPDRIATSRIFLAMQGPSTHETLPPGGLSGQFVKIVIEDQGEGIPRETLPKVFEPFFTTKAVGKGSGLGLSQAYGFARQSGGTLTIESQVGVGTGLTFYLPAAGSMNRAPQSS